MAFMEWTKELSVGIISIDKEHQQLIEMINDFYENIKIRSNNENISRLIHGMNQYTIEHFATEEKYMQQYNYPGYESHKKAHDIFIAKVEDIESRYNDGLVILSFEITGFLKEWWRNHILVTDKKYSDFFINNGVK